MDNSLIKSTTSNPIKSAYLKPNSLKPDPVKSKAKLYNNDVGNNLNDQELMKILLAETGLEMNLEFNLLYKNLISQFGNIKEVINADPLILRNISGINENIIAKIKAVKEVILRYNHQNIDNKIIIESWKALLDYCYVLFANLNYEQLHILYLNKTYQLIFDELHSAGNIEAVEVDVTEIVRKSLSYYASYIILVHNHPGGNLEPSKADIENTIKISQALKAVNIKIHDHLIISGDNYYSFRSNDLII
jgi:DNA repair protein RadC